jgi:hypothetical protein
MKDNSGTYMFLIDIPLRGGQDRSNRSSIVHAVSYFACGVNYTACTVHAVSLIPHAHVRGPGRMFWWKKTEGRKSRGTVPLSKNTVTVKKKNFEMRASAA